MEQGAEALKQGARERDNEGSAGFLCLSPHSHGVLPALDRRDSADPETSLPVDQVLALPQSSGEHSYTLAKRLAALSGGWSSSRRRTTELSE